MPTVADALAEAIHEAGIDVVFGLPGGENVQVLDALRRRGLAFVLVHHEASAVFMADATARLTGWPGVCLTTLGPGAANSVAGVANAYLDRAPVLVLTAQMAEARGPDYTHQVLDLHALFAPVTKQSVRLGPHHALQTARAALALTVRGRPGPVHVQVSNDDAAQPATGDASPPERLAAGEADPRAVAAACAALAQARRPVLVAGLGLEPEAPYAALGALAEALRAPVLLTPKAKGSLPADHPLYGGVIGLTMRDPAYDLLAEADCIVGVGFDVVELVKPWDAAAPFIWLAGWANAGPTLPAVAECVGASGPVLRQLAAVSVKTAAGWGAPRVAAHWASLARRALPPPLPGRVLPQTVLDVLRRNLPRDTCLTVDVGSHKILASLAWPALAPNRFLVSNGLSCMGSALPYATAASRALAGSRTVCLTGDGGLLMAMGELATLARLALPVTVVVLNDGALDLIRSQQQRAGKPVFGTEFASTDWQAAAGALGLVTYRADSADSLTAAVQATQAAARPALIEVLIDPASYPTSAWTAGQEA